MSPSTPPNDKSATMSAIYAYIQQPPGISRSDYANPDDEPAQQAVGRRAYERTKRRLSRQLQRAIHELAEFDAHPYDALRLRQAAEHANSGRLTIDATGAITYEAAQDERTEYRQAAIAVLADYNRLSRRAARRAQLPRLEGDRHTPPTPPTPIYRISPPSD